MKRVFNLVIVDESGSMSVIEQQALAGMNETLRTVRKMQDLHPDMEQRVTLITFDSGHRTFLFDNVPAAQTRELTAKDYNPGGATPLYDAIGIGISKMNAQTSVDDNVLVTIITDGEENCSREYNLKMVKTLIEKMKKLGWTFSLIGTDDLDVEGMASSMSIDNHLSFKGDAEGTERMFVAEACARERFNRRLARGDKSSASRYFDDEE